MEHRKMDELVAKGLNLNNQLQAVINEIIAIAREEQMFDENHRIKDEKVWFALIDMAYLEPRFY